MSCAPTVCPENTCAPTRFLQAVGMLRSKPGCRRILSRSGNRRCRTRPRGEGCDLRLSRSGRPCRAVGYRLALQNLTRRAVRKQKAAEARCDGAEEAAQFRTVRDIGQPIRLGPATAVNLSCRKDSTMVALPPQSDAASSSVVLPPGYVPPTSIERALMVAYGGTFVIKSIT